DKNNKSPAFLACGYAPTGLGALEAFILFDIVEYLCSKVK
ncbi:MAG: hypothetical protein ACI8ZX_002818, partial [Planctomycetota bacterium]